MKVAETFPLTLSADTPKDLASELVHYAFINAVHLLNFLPGELFFIVSSFVNRNHMFLFEFLMKGSQVASTMSVVWCRKTSRRWLGSWKTPSVDTGSGHLPLGAHSEGRGHHSGRPRHGWGREGDPAHWPHRWRKRDSSRTGSQSCTHKEQRTQLRRENGTSTARRWAWIVSKLFRWEGKENASSERETEGTSDWRTGGIMVEPINPTEQRKIDPSPYLKGLLCLNISWQLRFSIMPLSRTATFYFQMQQLSFHKDVLLFQASFALQHPLLIIYTELWTKRNFLKPLPSQAFRSSPF